MPTNANYNANCKLYCTRTNAAVFAANCSATVPLTSFPRYELSNVAIELASTIESVLT